VPRILVTDAINLGEARYPDIEVVERPGITRAELLASIGAFEGLITRSRTDVDEALLRAATRLKAIGRGGVGVDNIDLEAASRRGIVVLNAPESNTTSAAEFTIALMLAAARGLARSDRDTRAGRWDRAFLGRELTGARLGIVGLGRIGSQVAQRASGLGMTPLAFDPYITRRRAEELGVALFERLEALLGRADVLTLHTPLNDETRGMIGAAELALLPPGAIVVNAARGGIVDEAALAAALERGHLFAAGIDVFAQEPPPPDHPLLGRADVVLSAHVGANTVEAQARVGAEILERTALALLGDLSRGAVNAPALDPRVVKALGRYLELGEVLGRMASQLAPGRVRELTVRCEGSFAEPAEPIEVAVAKGFLETILDEPPNYVSAVAIARERGVRLRFEGAPASGAYRRAVKVVASGAGPTTEVAGTVLGDQPRIVAIDGYPIEIRPQGTMLICTNYDRPGAIGKVGTVLGEAGVNISSMQLSRVGADGLAMFALTLDQVPPEPVLELLRGLHDVILSLRIARL
jgi:D-3-phosphoglycerate dehydrogenase / 2-oxoglutarate reductase